MIESDTAMSLARGEIEEILFRYATALDRRDWTALSEYSDRLELRAEGWRIVHLTLVVQHVVDDIGVALRPAS